MTPAERPSAHRPRVYVTPFAGEGPRQYTVTSDADGVTLRGADGAALPVHVDAHGIVWEPWHGEPTGRQLHGTHHPVRQAEAMENLLCVGCGQQPDDEPQSGMLWVLSSVHLPARWPCDISTTVPPVCAPCAQWAVHDCQGLRDGFMRVRARESRIVGVEGTLYLPGRPPENRTIPRDDGAIRYFVARQLVIRLEGAVLDPLPVPEYAHVGTAT